MIRSHAFSAFLQPGDRFVANVAESYRALDLRDANDISEVTFFLNDDVEEALLILASFEKAADELRRAIQDVVPA